MNFSIEKQQINNKVQNRPIRIHSEDVASTDKNNIDSCDLGT